jgi:hypothetical protein
MAVRMTLFSVLSAALLVSACQGSSPVIGSLTQPETAAPLGTPCVAGDEAQPQFSGYDANEVNIENGSPSCESGVCLYNHFQGRASCPYGQTADQAQNAPACFLPGTNEPVRVAVAPQRQDRRAEAVATCSCRCAGPGAGPFCTCSAGMECVELIQPNAALSNDALSGSYCILPGTGFDRSVTSTPVCQDPPNDCGNPRPY